MQRRALYWRICAVAGGLMLAACSGGSSSLPSGMPVGPQGRSSSSPIKHVVLIVQENRSFDNLFAKFPGANGATRGKEKVKVGGKYVDKWVTLASHKLTHAKRSAALP